MSPRKKAAELLEIDYVLQRSGYTDILLQGHAHCSVDTRRTRLRYHVKIWCTHLDNKKFVFAQEDLHMLFSGTCVRTVELSCEALAAQYATELRQRVIRAINSEKVRVAVRISPPPYVGSATAIVGKVR